MLPSEGTRLTDFMEQEKTDEEIEERKIEEAKKQAEEALKQKHLLSEEEYATAAANLQKALAQLKIKRRHRRI